MNPRNIRRKEKTEWEITARSKSRLIKVELDGNKKKKAEQLEEEGERNMMKQREHFAYLPL